MASDAAVQALQTMFATQYAAIAQCTGGQPITVQVRWDAAGAIAVGLAAPLTGTPTEQCVQQAVGAIQLQGVTAPGEVHAQF